MNALGVLEYIDKGRKWAKCRCGKYSDASSLPHPNYTHRTDAIFYVCVSCNDEGRAKEEILAYEHHMMPIYTMGEVDPRWKDPCRGHMCECYR